VVRVTLEKEIGLADALSRASERTMEQACRATVMLEGDGVAEVFPAGCVVSAGRPFAAEAVSVSVIGGSV